LKNERPDGLEQARQLGRLKAERLDLTLRREEQRERERRFARLAWDGGGEELPTPYGESDPAMGEVWRLRQDVERLAAFHGAVLRSRAWRLVQLARRPFGRAW
jgi:broad specificity phosphatase PhoE